MSAGILIVLKGSDDQDYFSAETLESGFLERIIDFSTNSRRGAKGLCADAAMAPNEASAPISRPRRLARDCKRLPEMLAGPHRMVFATLMLMNDREVLA